MLQGIFWPVWAIYRFVTQLAAFAGVSLAARKMVWGDITKGFVFLGICVLLLACGWKFCEAITADIPVVARWIIVIGAWFVVAVACYVTKKQSQFKIVVFGGIDWAMALGLGVILYQVFGLIAAAGGAS